MEPTLRLIAGLMKILSWFSTPFFWIATMTYKEKLAPIDNQLLFLSATSLSEKIRRREVKSEDVIKAYIERIKAVNPIINAVVEDRFTEALEEAKAVDKYLQTQIVNLDELRGSQPLLGVPLTVKESCSLKGLSKCVGSNNRTGIKASEDGTTVALLRQAGAIPLLVSNTPEFCMFWESNNLITGCTKNPYKPGRSAAGSSGGEGALLGAGASVIGIGSDLAGSIRLPALFNGVFGHKPSTGIVSSKKHFPKCDNHQLTHCLSIGPLTRYAEDLPLMLRIISGENSIGLRLNEEVDLGSVNVYFMKQFGQSIAFHSVSKEIKALIEKCATHLQVNCRSNIEEFKFDLDNAVEISSAMLFSIEDIPKILENPNKSKGQDNLYLNLFKSVFGVSKYSRNGLFFTVLDDANGFIPKNKVKFYEEEFLKLKESFVNKLQHNSVFLCPTFPTPAFRHNEFMFYTDGVKYLSTFNLLGFPCTNIPVGLNKDGLPIGIQVVASTNQDRLCLAVAKELEKAYGGWQPPS